MLEYLYNSFAGLVGAYDAGYVGVDFRSTIDYAYGVVLDRTK